jgi:heavy metal translocating P-type ATPase
MVIEILVLSSVLGISYKNLQQQREKYKKELLSKQQQQNQQLKALQNGEITEVNNVEVRTSRALSRTPKDLVVLIGAVGLSSVGGYYYRPLIFLVPPLVLYAARKRIITSAKMLREGKVGVETLSSLSIIGAMVGQRFFIGSLLGLINAAGDVLATKVIHDSQHKLIDVFKDMPESVWLIKDGVEVTTPLSSVRAGDIVVVNAGEVIPADGKIVWGMAGIDEHRFTGESIPVEKGKDDNVFAMTLVLSGKIHFVIEKAGAASSAMQIANILNHTADYKSSTVLEAQALSRQLTKPTLLASAMVWPIFGFSAAVSMLFAHPKERLQVAAPISIMNYLKRAMDEGVLIKDGRSLELLYKVDTIVFDKTGTLTEDKPHVGEIYTFAEYSENEVLHYAVVAEHKQTHPLAQAIFAEAKLRGIDIAEPEHSEYHLGYGIKVNYQQQTIMVGSLRFMTGENIAVPAKLEQLQDDCRLLGHGLIMVAIDQQLIGAIELLPTIRPEAKSAILALKQLKRIKETYIISGDHEIPTQKLAEELGIDHYFAQVLPQQKAELIEKLQQEGKFVCFIGDGINDAIAMKQAQVSISLSGASQLATDTAQILLLNQGISHLPPLFKLSAGFNHHMRNQYAIILGPSILGVSMVILSGWGMSNIMVLNMIALTTTISYSMLDKPKDKFIETPQQRKQRELEAEMEALRTINKRLVNKIKRLSSSPKTIAEPDPQPVIVVPEPKKISLLQKILPRIIKKSKLPPSSD